nr:RNA-directed DNA polymerase, eukaryota [Tanacetum cinerariifolium]
RMFTRSIVIQRRMEDLQLGVESYQKKINLTRPDTYRSDLKRKEAYIADLNPRGFIYQNKDKQNRLMRIDELHKFSDGTLCDVRTALNDRLKGIRMKYLPQTIWRKSDKDGAATMIQAIDKMLKTKRIMRSLERYKVVRHRYSNPMIQPELEGSTKGYPLVSVEVFRYDKRSKSENMGIVPTEMELILEYTQQGISHEVSVNPYGFAVTPTKHGRMTKPYSSHHFIANCFNAGNLKIEVKIVCSAYRPYTEYSTAVLDHNDNVGYDTEVISFDLHVPPPVYPQDVPLLVNEIVSWAKKRFGAKWKTWIQVCLNSAYASVLMNGSPTKEFKIEKGLRQVPTTIINKLKSIRRNFFWGGNFDERKMAWIAWDKVIAPLDQGGINIGSLKVFNQAMLSKWWWHFLNEENAFWRKIIISIHGDQRGLSAGSFLPYKMGPCSAKASVLVNGSPTIEFPFHCGLKQGDSLSLYLFILIMESLNMSFTRAIDKGVFKGVHLHGSTFISHFFYADDVMFIGEWSDDNLK